MIIGISGKKGHGKDLVAKIIQYLVSEDARKQTGYDISFDDFLNKAWNEETLSGWKVKRFADKLKDMVCMLLGCTRKQLENREFKKKELGEEWYLYEVVEFNKIITQEEFDNLTDNQKEYFELVKLTPRKILQLLGTEAGRNIIHPNIWVNALMSEYKNYSRSEFTKGKGIINPNPVYPNWIIPDVRFPNELAAVKAKGGITIRIERPSVISDDNHESETALDDAEFDYTVINEGTVEELINKVEDILIKENVIKE